MSLAATTDALVVEIISKESRYPDGTMFLAADSITSVLDAIREERAFVIVLPDRTEIACEPKMNPIARLRRRLWWPILRFRADLRPRIVVERDGAYDISRPPVGFSLHLRHTTAAP